MNLFIDIANQKMIRSLSGGTVTGYTFVLRDALPVKLYLVAEQSNITAPYAVTAITAGHSVKFGAKLALTDTTYLVEQATWTETGSGSDTYYAASIPLDGAALIAAVSGLASLALHAEFTTQDGDGKHYSSTQFTLTIIPDVITGSEA